MQVCEGGVDQLHWLHGGQAGSTGKKRCESTCSWNGTWLGMLYRHFSNSRLSLEGGRGMPTLGEGDRFLVDLVEADKVEMVRE